MDEEKKEYPMDYTEEEELLAESPTDEELLEEQRVYGEEAEEGLRERESPFVEAEEEYRTRDVGIIEDEEIREREARMMESEDEYRGRESTPVEAEDRTRQRERSAMEKELIPLLNRSEAEEFRSRWQEIQTDFVDDPRSSVEMADELVARVINSITENFASERTALEDQWNRGEEASTEDMRIAIKRYRSFFNRLLTLEFMGPEENR